MTEQAELIMTKMIHACIDADQAGWTSLCINYRLLNAQVDTGATRGVALSWGQSVIVY